MGEQKDLLKEVITKAIRVGIPIEQETIDKVADAVRTFYEEKPAEKIDFIEALGTFLKIKGETDSGAVKLLQEALGKHGYLMVNEEALIKYMAQSRIVPGNTARQVIEKLKKVLGYGSS